MRPFEHRSSPTCALRPCGSNRRSKRSPRGGTRSFRRSKSNNVRPKARIRPAKFRSSRSSTSAVVSSTAAPDCSTPRPTFNTRRSRSNGVSGVLVPGAEDSMHHSCGIVVLTLLMAGCSGSGSEQAAHEAPATVAHPRTEAELSTIKLTADAVKRLGVETVTVRPIRPRRPARSGARLWYPQAVASLSPHRSRAR